MTNKSTRLEFSCASDEFKVAVCGHGVKVEIDSDGNVTVYSDRPAKWLPPEAASAVSAKTRKYPARTPDVDTQGHSRPLSDVSEDKKAWAASFQRKSYH